MEIRVTQSQSPFDFAENPCWAELFACTLAVLTRYLDSECERLCRLKRWPSAIFTPAALAAGLRWSATKTDEKTGILPLAFRDGKTKSESAA